MFMTGLIILAGETCLHPSIVVVGREHASKFLFKYDSINQKVIFPLMHVRVE